MFLCKVCWIDKMSQSPETSSSHECQKAAGHVCVVKWQLYWFSTIELHPICHFRRNCAAILCSPLHPFLIVFSCELVEWPNWKYSTDNLLAGRHLLTGTHESYTCQLEPTDVLKAKLKWKHSTAPTEVLIEIQQQDQGEQHPQTSQCQVL